MSFELSIHTLSINTLSIHTEQIAFAYDLLEAIEALSLNVHVTLCFEPTEGCVLQQHPLASPPLPLLELLKPLGLATEQRASLDAHHLRLELGGRESQARLAQTKVVLQAANPAHLELLERQLEPVGFEQVRSLKGAPQQSVLRYGGASLLSRAMLSWWASRLGYHATWAHVWGMHERELWLSLPLAQAPERPATLSREPSKNTSQPPQPLSKHEPLSGLSSWSIEVSCDDEAEAEALITRLKAEGFGEVRRSSAPLPAEHVGVELCWGGGSDEEVTLAVWGALSDHEKASGLERLEPRFERHAHPVRPTRRALTLYVRSLVRGELALRSFVQHQMSELELCLRSEGGELSPLARSLRALKPKQLKVLNLEAWSSLCELLSLVAPLEHPEDLEVRGLIWGEVRCPPRRLAVAAWLQGELERVTEKRPLLVVSEALSPHELWLLAPQER